jgi:adenylate cyclase
MGAQTTVHTTVVFADLIGSTGVFEATGNARATRAVTKLTQWICDVFTAHNGKVVKTLGDGVLALFPVAQNAIDAAVELQRNHQNHIASTIEAMRMPIRVGMASGPVEIVANDCYGDSVNVAARLSDLCGAHQIWASDTVTAGASATGGVRFRSLGLITVRGRSEACSVSQIEWRSDDATDFLTMPGVPDPATVIAGRDALGAEVQLSCLDVVKSFKSFDLPIHIGRVPSVGFFVNDPRVSREHARLEWRNGSVMLVDVSSYGSWVRFGAGRADLLLRRNECILYGKGEIALGAPFSDISVPTVSFAVS